MTEQTPASRVATDPEETSPVVSEGAKPEHPDQSDASSAYLRRAAAKMRRQAKAAMTGDAPSLSARWFHEPDGQRYDVIAEDEGSFIANRIHRAAAVHVASWDPATALAVADWLDYAAQAAHALGRHRQLALALAQTYVGDI